MTFVTSDNWKSTNEILIEGIVFTFSDSKIFLMDFLKIMKMSVDKARNNPYDVESAEMGTKE